ncbi:uracil-DNA glycosylase family protein [Flavobacterium collinsii]|jgi:uracil-DNA glycosylase|uniref:uracil-DNA glycosylase family protein n=1 Tax=Flavobacterium collinsii TaxID=1114861 RepID=UPI0037580205
MEELLEQIKNCRVCEDYLKDGVNPVVAVSRKSKIVIIGQAPGRIVHNTNIAWNDKSGDNLRNWLQIDKTVFYNTDKIALMPMGFCFPGTGKTGDLPPRPECAPLWHEKVLKLMPDAELVLLVGQYSQKYYLGKNVKSTLTETVQNFEDYLPYFFPLPHPSPRNNIWQAKNEWFQDVVLPQLREKVKDILRE